MFSRRIQIGFSPRYALNSLLSVILIFLSSIQVFCNNVGRSRQLHRLFDRVYVDTNSSSELAYLVIEASEDLRELHLVNSWVYRYFFFFCLWLVITLDRVSTASIYWLRKPQGFCHSYIKAYLWYMWGTSQPCFWRLTIMIEVHLSPWYVQICRENIVVRILSWEYLRVMRNLLL